MNILNGEYYKDLLSRKTENYVFGINAPRGRILDTNGVVLVDNIGIKTIFYQKLKGITMAEEVDIAYRLASIVDVPINKDSLKEFWLLNNNFGADLITQEEYELYKKRKLTSLDIKNLKYKRVTEELLNKMSNLDKEAASIYKLMNKGYSYDKKNGKGEKNKE